MEKSVHLRLDPSPVLPEGHVRGKQLTSSFCLQTDAVMRLGTQALQIRRGRLSKLTGEEAFSLLPSSPHFQHWFLPNQTLKRKVDLQAH